MSTPPAASIYGATPTRRPSGRGGQPLRAPLPHADPLVQARKRTLESSLAEATGVADLTEWESFRRECLGLAQRSMTLAETGARLLKACSRSAGVLAAGDEAFPFTSFAGSCGSARVTPDLLPLPLPRFPAAGSNELDRLFPPGAPTSLEGYKYGAQAWLHLVVYGLNQMYTGSARPAAGPPTEAQKRAIALLFEVAGMPGMPTCSTCQCRHVGD